MWEDGFVIDKLVLTTDAGYVPLGTGPAESPRGMSALAGSGVVTSAVGEGRLSAVQLSISQELDLGSLLAGEVEPAARSAGLDMGVRNSLLGDDFIRGIIGTFQGTGAITPDSSGGADI